MSLTVPISDLHIPAEWKPLLFTPFFTRSAVCGDDIDDDVDNL